MHGGKTGQAERIVREYLKARPTDVNAIRLLADIGMKLSRYREARDLLARCLELAPDFHLARYNYAVVLTRRNQLPEALEEARRVLASDSANPNYLLLEGNVLVQMGDHEHALERFERVLATYPNHPRAQMNYGHALKTVGRLDESIAAYRRCIALQPGIGDAYWSLANFKTYRFTDEELARMRGQVDPDAAPAHRPLSSVLRARQSARGSWRVRCVFDFYARGKGWGRSSFARKEPGAPPPTRSSADGRLLQRPARPWTSGPIFIVGLPRSGSTLLEQILVLHSSVEGTVELADESGLAAAGKSRRSPGR